MRPMLKKNVLFPAILALLVIGSAGLAHLMQQPRFAAYRTVDVLQMTGSGMCFGVALVALIALLKGRRA
jgi:hypothetical protein